MAVKTRRVRLARCVACVSDMRSTYKILVGKADHLGF